MKKLYDFPASAEGMLKSYRKHAEALINTTDFLSPSHGYERIAHFSLLDDLLSYVYYLESGRWPEESLAEKLPARPSELGPFKMPAILADIENLKAKRK